MSAASLHGAFWLVKKGLIFCHVIAHCYISGSSKLDKPDMQSTAGEVGTNS